MKLVIYGIGSVTDDIERRIKTEHEIIAYTDSMSDISVYKSKPFIGLNYLNTIQFDYIIIAVINPKTAWNIYLELCKDKKIPKEKIIPFYCWGNRELYRIQMKSSPIEEIKGLIFGSSMSRFGILTECLSEKFINLSVLSQDIYYNYITFKRIKNYWNKKNNNLKYIIIDMYDYNVFNYDLSLSKFCLGYIEWGG